MSQCDSGHRGAEYVLRWLPRSKLSRHCHNGFALFALSTSASLPSRAVGATVVLDDAWQRIARITDAKITECLVVGFGQIDRQIVAQKPVGNLLNSIS
jgi:hypothetical protein